MSRNEADPQGAVEPKAVEEVFVRLGRVLHLRLPDGVMIRTTGEHPFFPLRTMAWTPARELREGDALLGRSGELAIVEAVEDTGEYETVYNLRVADFHTYFVGRDEWGFSVWAHNAYRQFVEDMEQRGLSEPEARAIWLAATGENPALGSRVERRNQQTELRRLLGIGSTSALTSYRRS